MAEMKHTRDSYTRGKRSLAKFIYVDGVHIGNAVTVDIAKRMIVCLNACAGMQDPAAEIAALRQRIAELEAQVPKKPQPNWNEAPEWAMWWAVDKDGYAWWYQHEPPASDYQWLLVRGGVLANAGSVALNGYDWRETLTQRPE